MTHIAKLTTAIGALILCMGKTGAQELKFYKKYRKDEVNLSEQLRASPDNKLVLLGTIRRPNSQGQTIRDMLLVKTQLNGDTVWTKHIGRDERSETGRDFDILPNGNMLLTGSSAYDNGNKVQGFLMCVDTAGNLLWDRYYGNDTAAWAFTSIKVLPDGILLAGTAGDQDHADALVLKTSMAGDSLWSTTVGGDAYDDAWDVEAAGDGGYLFTGGTYSFATGDFDDAWVVKLDTAGNYLWRKTFGLPGRVDWAWAFTPSRNNAGTIDGYVFTGVKNAGQEGTPGALQGDVHFSKIDLDGNLVWDKSLVTPAGKMRREGTDIIRTADGGYAICAFGIGPNNIAPYFIRTDGAGNILYQALFDNVTELFFPKALVEAPDSTFYVTGTVMASPSAPTDMFLAHIGPAAATGTALLSADRSVEVFPNPAKEHITIHAKGATYINYIDVMSIDGRKLATITAHGKAEIVVPVGAYSGSIILLHIMDEDGVSIYKKVAVL